MRSVLIAALTVGCLQADPLPVGITRGSLLSIASNQIEVRRSDGAVYNCSYDSHTFFQRDRWPVQAGQLVAGEPIEVLSDRRPGSHQCYTRMLSVVHALPGRPAPVVRREVAPLYGSLTFSGTVVREDGSSLTIRTHDGEHALRLRADTRYSQDGVRLDRRAPLVNKHVFVRAGHGTSGAVEAYQVMWGEVFTPN